MKAGKHLQMGGVGAVLFASAALAGAPVAFDAGVVRNAPGLEPKPFAAENGSRTFAWEPNASPYVELAFQKPVTLPRIWKPLTRNTVSGTPCLRALVRKMS